MEKQPLRMYHLVHRSLSPIQKGIQAGHGAVEYVSMHARKDELSQKVLQFVEKDKTFIVLDGGTSTDMHTHMEALNKMNVPYAVFTEPDMEDMKTCISFLSDDDYVGFTAWVNDFKLAN